MLDKHLRTIYYLIRFAVLLVNITKAELIHRRHQHGNGERTARLLASADKQVINGSTAMRQLGGSRIQRSGGDFSFNGSSITGHMF